MTLMTPINKIPATSVRHPEADSADRLVACAAVMSDMLAEAARALDLADSLPVDCRFGLHQQSRMRLTGVHLLLAELNAQGEDVGRTIMSEITDIADTSDAELVREMAERMHHLITAKIRNVRLRMSWDRYAS